jgi:dynamin 1-like protein
LFQTLDEIPLEAENVEKGYADLTGLPKAHNLPVNFYDTSPKNRSRSKAHSGEQQSSFLHSNSDANGIGSYSQIGI